MLPQESQVAGAEVLAAEVWQCGAVTSPFTDVSHCGMAVASKAYFHYRPNNNGYA